MYDLPKEKYDFKVGNSLNEVINHSIYGHDAPKI